MQACWPARVTWAGPACCTNKCWKAGSGCWAGAMPTPSTAWPGWQPCWRKWGTWTAPAACWNRWPTAAAACLALAETLAAQCDLGRVGQLCGPLAAACERRFGSHPPLRSEALHMASALARQAGLMSAATAPPCEAKAQAQPPCQPLRSSAAPHESGFTPPAQYGAGGGYDHGGDCTVDACEIERGVIRLEQMEDRAADEARELADRLREPVLLADLAPLVRARGVRAIVDVYFYQGDTDAMIAFMQEQRPMPIR